MYPFKMLSVIIINSHCCNIQAIDAINVGETSGLTAEFYSQGQLCEPGGQ